MLAAIILVAQKFANPRVWQLFFVYWDREQLAEAKFEEKSKTLWHRLLISRYAAYHAQMYAHTQTKIIFMVFAIQDIKATCMYMWL